MVRNRETTNCMHHPSGARISFVFHEIFANGVRELDPFDQLSDADIRTVLYNAAVRRLSHMCVRGRIRRSCMPLLEVRFLHHTGLVPVPVR